MDDEIAFYDVLEVNDSAVKVLSAETLRTIAYELARAVKSNLTVDWTVRENVRAQMYLAQIRLPPTSRKKPRRRSWNRPSCSPPIGPHNAKTLTP